MEFFTIWINESAAQSARSNRQYQLKGPTWLKATKAIAAVVSWPHLFRRFLSVFQPWQHTKVSCIASESVPTYTSASRQEQILNAGISSPTAPEICKKFLGYNYRILLLQQQSRKQIYLYQWYINIVHKRIIPKETWVKGRISALDRFCPWSSQLWLRWTRHQDARKQHIVGNVMSQMNDVKFLGV